MAEGTEQGECRAVGTGGLGVGAQAAPRGGGVLGQVGLPSNMAALDQAWEAAGGSGDVKWLYCEQMPTVRAPAGEPRLFLAQ